ncbi:Asx homology domain-containing protein [Limtongia smithiae]|uniref:Asx homology domain-containing protein n=1 Tax=Limtongia smithiae TaxID=1125753 RepID=UPI0034CDEDE6
MAGWPPSASGKSQCLDRVARTQCRGHHACIHVGPRSPPRPLIAMRRSRSDRHDPPAHTDERRLLRQSSSAPPGPQQPRFNTLPSRPAETPSVRGGLSTSTRFLTAINSTLRQSGDDHRPSVTRRSSRITPVPGPNPVGAPKAQAPSSTNTTVPSTLPDTQPIAMDFGELQVRGTPDPEVHSEVNHAVVNTMAVGKSSTFVSPATIIRLQSYTEDPDSSLSDVPSSLPDYEDYFSLARSHSPAPPLAPSLAPSPLSPHVEQQPSNPPKPAAYRRTTSLSIRNFSRRVKDTTNSDGDMQPVAPSLSPPLAQVQSPGATGPTVMLLMDMNSPEHIQMHAVDINDKGIDSDGRHSLASVTDSVHVSTEASDEIPTQAILEESPNQAMSEESATSDIFALEVTATEMSMEDLSQFPTQEIIAQPSTQEALTLRVNSVFATAELPTQEIIEEGSSREKSGETPTQEIIPELSTQQRRDAPTQVIQQSITELDEITPASLESGKVTDAIMSATQKPEDSEGHIAAHVSSVRLVTPRSEDLSLESTVEYDQDTLVKKFHNVDYVIPDKNLSSVVDDGILMEDEEMDDTCAEHESYPDQSVTVINIPDESVEIQPLRSVAASDIERISVALDEDTTSASSEPVVDIGLLDVTEGITSLPLARASERKDTGPTEQESIIVIDTSKLPPPREPTPEVVSSHSRPRHATALALSYTDLIRTPITTEVTTRSTRKRKQERGGVDNADSGSKRVSTRESRRGDKKLVQGKLDSKFPVVIHSSEEENDADTTVAMSAMSMTNGNTGPKSSRSRSQMPSTTSAAGAARPELIRQSSSAFTISLPQGRTPSRASLVLTPPPVTAAPAISAPPVSTSPAVALSPPLAWPPVAVATAPPSALSPTKEITTFTSRLPPAKKGVPDKYTTEYLLTNSRSPLVSISDLSFLVNEDSFNALPESARAHLMSILAPVDHAPPSPSASNSTPRPVAGFFSHNTVLQEAIRDFQSDISLGRYTKSYARDLSRARAAIARGSTDKYKDNEFELWWGQRSRGEI